LMAQNAPIFDQTSDGVPLTSTLREREAADAGDTQIASRMQIENGLAANTSLAVAAFGAPLGRCMLVKRIWSPFLIAAGPFDRRGDLFQDRRTCSSSTTESTRYTI